MRIAPHTVSARACGRCPYCPWPLQFERLTTTHAADCASAANSAACDSTIAKTVIKTRLGPNLEPSCKT
ncbi:hypothetical protein IG631_10084 [Alternaria alternata]|nr:hypothetical protein IG631_10084 [Alternaria alternata]